MIHYGMSLQVFRPAVRLKSHHSAIALSHRSCDLQPCLTVGLCVPSPGCPTLPFSVLYTNMALGGLEAAGSLCLSINNALFFLKVTVYA